MFSRRINIYYNYIPYYVLHVVLIDKIELTIVLVRFIYFTLLKRLAYKLQNTMLGLASLKQSLLMFLWWLANAALARCRPTETTSVVTKRTSTEHYARSPIASLSVMTRTCVLTHTDGRNYILKFLVTLIFEDFCVMNLIGTFVLRCKLAKSARNCLKDRKKGPLRPFSRPPTPQ